MWFKLSVFLIFLLTSASTALGAPANGSGAWQTPSPSVDPPTAMIFPWGHQGGVKIEGIGYPSFQQNVYLGVPYAKPPIGDLRFTPAQTASYNSTIVAQSQPKACLQDPSNPGAGTAGVSEDCLYLNIFAPSSADATRANLPVMFWVFGGGFTNGTVGTFNASALVETGQQMGKPVIWVGLQYRLGAMGFSGGQTIQSNGAANLGLRDVMFALQWVQDNIGAFGGDKNQVTVFGESAGAMLTAILYLIPSAQSLFRSAIMESGGQSGMPIGPTTTMGQPAYDDLAAATNCTNDPKGSLQCLKGISAEQMLDAQAATLAQYPGGYPYNPSIDGDLITDSPYNLVQAGKFLRKPLISGSNLDEGTLFSSPNETVSGLVDFLNGFSAGHLSSNVISALVNEFYPNDPSVGSPYGTGNDTFGISPVFKQQAAILGDLVLQAPRRHFVQSATASGLPDVWSYLFTETANEGALPVYLGAYHSKDIEYVYGEVSTASGFTQAQVNLSKTMMQYWINFATDLDPNGGSLTNWPKYGDGSGKQMLQLNSTNTTLITDTYRQAQMQYLLDNHAQLNY